MSILASGAIRATDAVDYIGKLKGIDSVVFGASSNIHILETKNLLEKFFKTSLRLRKPRPVSWNTKAVPINFLNVTTLS